MIALLSIAASAYLILFSDRVFTILEKYLAIFERRKTHGEPRAPSRYDLVLFGYQKGGHEFIKVFKQLDKNFVVIDYDPEMIDILEHQKINFLYGDATDVELLEEAGVEHAKLVVSTMTDFESSKFLLSYLERKNSNAVFIAQADNPRQASELYERGASYVILPHFIGSEQISAFVRRSGLHKKAFTKARAKHLKILERQLRTLEKTSEQDKKLGKAVVKGVAALTRAKT